jgi:hypothetical protein
MMIFMITLNSLEKVDSNKLTNIFLYAKFTVVVNRIYNVIFNIEFN